MTLCNDAMWLSVNPSKEWNIAMILCFLTTIPPAYGNYCHVVYLLCILPACELNL